MGRLVQPQRIEAVQVPRTNGLEAAGGTMDVAIGGDGFADRIAKYIPGEVIAGYMALDRSLVPSAETFNDKKRLLMERAAQGTKIMSEAIGAGPPMMAPEWHLFVHRNLPIAVLAMGLVFTPLYIRQMAINAGGGIPWRTHAAVATLAFFVWAYAIQGSAFTLGPAGQLYDGTYASALVVVFTLVSGLFSPSPMRANSTGAGAQVQGRAL